MIPLGAPRGETRRGRRVGWKGLVLAVNVILAAQLSTSNVAAEAPTDVIVRVVVADSAGAPMAGVAVLATVLWTSKADYERHGKARGRLLRTDAWGELMVPIKLDRQQQASAARNGDWANISIVALDSTGRPIAQTTTSRFVGSQADTLERARPIRHRDTVRLLVRTSQRERQSPDGSDLQRALPSCTYYWDADAYWNRYAQVGELHADSDVRHARFTYGETADTTFDVGAKTGTQAWSITGSVHVANTRAAAVYADTAGQSNYHWALRTQFRFVNMKLFKDCIGGPYRAWVGSQEVYALEWTGNGMTLSNPVTQPLRKGANTASYGPNTGWARASGTLVKWVATVTAWGASIGAQSGASTNVRIEYSFGARQTHYLYGDTGLPTSSKRVFQDTP